MKVQLPFGRELLEVDLPGHARVLHPVPVEPIADELVAVHEALRSPLAGPPLRERVRPGQTVAVVISDITRPVPNETLLSPLLAELADAGIAAEDVTIVNGTGLHRANTPEELETMLGKRFARGYRIVQHVARDRSTLVETGSIEGVPVELCRAYVEADVRIVTGFVEPHLFAGFSGGAKGVMPGVAGADIVMLNHGAENLAHPRATWCVTEGNPVFEQMQAVAATCPPDFLLNVTLDPQRRITGVFAGDLAPAHQAAIEQARRQYQVEIEEPYDVVVVTNMGYPADTTFYQSVKGMSVAAEAVRKGGAIVLVAGCEEGLGSDDYASLLSEGSSLSELMAWIRSSEQPRHDQWQVQCQAMVQEKAEVYLHSRLSPEQTSSAHVHYCEDVESTVLRLLGEARSRGREASLLVLPHGQLTVPVIR